jgi:predicted ATPase
VDLGGWPFTVPVVRQLIAEAGLEIPAGVTILLGENGSGKSTLIEAIAAIYPPVGNRRATSEPVQNARWSYPAVRAITVIRFWAGALPRMSAHSHTEPQLRRKA